MLDARSGRLLSTTPVGLAGSYPVAMAADARTGRVVMATGNGVYVLAGHSGALLRTVAVGSACGAVAVDTQAGRAYVVGQVNAGGSMADLPGGEGGNILDTWSAQARRWLPWSERRKGVLMSRLSPSASSPRPAKIASLRASARERAI